MKTPTATVEKTGANTVKITVEVPAEEVKARVAAAYAEIGRRVKHPGFRPGKVPRRILEKTYGAEALQAAVDELVPAAFDRACEELALEPVTSPRYRLLAADASGPIRFEAEVAVFPEVKLPAYENFVVKRERPKITDAEVDRALENLRHYHARLEPVAERGALDGELVILNFDGPPPDGFSGKPLAVWASASETETFGRQVLGKKIGDQFELEVAYPSDYPVKRFAGKRIKVPVTVAEVKKPVPPTLDESFAKDLGEGSLAALRERVRDRLEARAAQLSYARAYHRFIDDVLARAEVPLADSFVEEFIAPGEGEAPLSEKERADRLAAARKELSRYFVVRALARREGITVTAEEVRAALAQRREDDETETPAAVYDRLLNEKLAAKLIPPEPPAAAGEPTLVGPGGV